MKTLIEAIKASDLEKVQSIIQGLSDIEQSSLGEVVGESDQKNSLLMVAINSRNIPIVEALLAVPSIQKSAHIWSNSALNCALMLGAFDIEYKNSGSQAA